LVGCILAVRRGEELKAAPAGFEAGLFEDGLVEEVPVPAFDCAFEGELSYSVSQTSWDLCEGVRVEVGAEEGAEMGWVLEPADAAELEVILAILGVELVGT
jgi:hypothetical protein